MVEKTANSNPSMASDVCEHKPIYFHFMKDINIASSTYIDSYEIVYYMISSVITSRLYIFTGEIEMQIFSL